MKFQLPKIRAVFPKLVSYDLVNTQLMSKPVSMVFYINYIFGKLKSGQTYYTKKVKTGWKICTIADVCSPKYHPHFAIKSGFGFTIYNSKGKIITCTEKISAGYRLDIENAATVTEEIIISENADSCF